MEQPQFRIVCQIILTGKLAREPSAIGKILMICKKFLPQIHASPNELFLKRKRLIWGVVIGVLVPISCLAQSLIGRPVKIDVASASPAVKVGTTAQFRVNLLDSENQLAPAKKDVAIQVEGRSPSGNTQTSTVFIKAGASSGTLEMPAREPGLVKLVASNRELASGGLVLNVGTAQQETSLPSPTPLASASPASALPTLSIGASASSAASPAIPNSHSDSVITIPASHFGTVVTPMAAVVTPMAAFFTVRSGLSNSARLTAARPTTKRAWNPALAFMYVPDRKIWADKIDAATVYANLPPNEVAPWDMLVYVMSSVGPLDPEPLVIPKGHNSGKARLTYDRPAAASVKFMSSVPWAKEVSGLPLTIAFGPTRLKMRTNPPKIGLFESTEVAIQLGDANGNSVSDDEKRNVLLAVESGGGALDDTSLTIEPNDAQVTTKFRPILPGTVRLLAESPNLVLAEAELIVATPIVILILCAIGGLAGGLLAFFTDKDAKWPRILIGVVTGFVFYWLFAFGLILIPNFQHILVFNPFSAAILAVFGGWLGTKVFSIGLEKIGINV